MRYLAFAFLAFIVIACGTEAELDDTEYPIQIGTWEVTSATRADWQGDAYMVQSEVAKATSDTVWVTEPEGQGLTLWVEHPQTGEGFITQDVMFTYEGPAGSLENESISGGWVSFSDSSVVRDGMSWIGADDFDIEDGRLFTEMGFGYNCGATPSEASEVTITLHQGPRKEPTAEQVYVFNTYGMADVIDHIYCYHPNKN